VVNAYDVNLGKTEANYQPLTPLVFLERSAKVFPDHTAIIHGSSRYSYAEFYARARRLASVLAAWDVGVGDTVSVMLANTPPMLEAHYGAPMLGAVLHSINTRLDAEAIAFMLDHAGTKVLIADTEFTPTLKAALVLAKAKPLIVNYQDLECGVEGTRLGEIESFLPPAKEAASTSSSSSAANGELSWIVNDYQAALTQAKAENKNLLIDFTGYTCTNCRWMETNMFPKPAVRGELEKFVRVRLFTDGEGEPYEGFQKMQEQRFGTVALPLYAIITPQDQITATFEGLTRNEEEFVSFLQKGAFPKSN